MMNKTRKAIVTTGPVTVKLLKTVQAYLPSNYSAVVNSAGQILISGEDRQGWTLDGYVIPRLASGLYFAEEVTDV